MAANGNSIATLSHHTYRSEQSQIIEASSQKEIGVINLGFWNLQNKYFSAVATGMRPNVYSTSKPNPGQILYTLPTNISYKYLDASGGKQEESIPLAQLNLPTNPTAKDLETALLSHINKSHLGRAVSVPSQGYPNSIPNRNKILYRSVDISYKYQDPSGGIQEETIPLTDLALPLAPTPVEVEKALLSHIQKKCPTFQPKPTSNNPFNENEDVPAYKARKERQIEQILKAIEAGEDFINLQDIDFLKIVERDPELKKVKEQLKQYFYQRLKAKGYDWVISEDENYSNPNNFQQQPLAVIYNAEKFGYMWSQGILPCTVGQSRNLRYCGLETNFSVKNPLGAVQTIVNVNFHLPYGRDSKAEIEAYQQQIRVQPNILHIMAGDCNSTALGSSEKYASIGKNADGAFTGMKKASDGAFVVAPRGCSVTTQINTGRSFQSSVDTNLGSNAKSSFSSTSSSSANAKFSFSFGFSSNSGPSSASSPSPSSSSNSGPSSASSPSPSSSSNSGPSSSSSPSSNLQPANQRGQVLFIVAKSEKFITAERYKELVSNGTHAYFELIDIGGNPARSKSKDWQQIPLAYPGNPPQALRNPKGKMNDKNRKRVDAVQGGAGLAEVAFGLTDNGGCALPIPTTFSLKDCENFLDKDNPEHRKNRQKLAYLQLHYAEMLLEQGVDIVFYLIDREWKQRNGKVSAFQPGQYILEKDGNQYELGFWGGAEDAKGAGTVLPAFYAENVRKLAQGIRLEIDIKELQDYIEQRKEKGEGFTLFGGFSKKTKIGAVDKLIAAITYYNKNNGDMAGFKGESLETEERNALLQEDSELEAAVELALPKLSRAYSIILDAIAPVPAPAKQSQFKPGSRTS